MESLQMSGTQRGSQCCCQRLRVGLLHETRMPLKYKAPVCYLIVSQACCRICFWRVQDFGGPGSIHWLGFCQKVDPEVALI